MKYKHSDIVEGLCTSKQYYGQFDTARELEVGKQYVNNKGTWQETCYTIVFIGHGVALGVETVSGVVGKCKYGIGSGSRELFISDGLMAGWKLNNSNPCYRLREVKQ